MKKDYSNLHRVLVLKYYWQVMRNFKVPMKKVGGLIVPTSKEIKENNRARSAKLRIATIF